MANVKHESHYSGAMTWFSCVKLSNELKMFHSDFPTTDLCPPKLCVKASELTCKDSLLPVQTIAQCRSTALSGKSPTVRQTRWL